jgi:hypothetical protein
VTATALTALAAALGEGGFLPLGQLAWEFLIGLGAALALGSLWALLRPGIVERRTGVRQPRPPSPARVKRNIAIGAVIAAVGVLGLIGSLARS